MVCLSTVYSYLDRVVFVDLARDTPLSSTPCAQGLTWLLVGGWGVELIRNSLIMPTLDVKASDCAIVKVVSSHAGINLPVAYI